MGEAGPKLPVNKGHIVWCNVLLHHLRASQPISRDGTLHYTTHFSTACHICNERQDEWL